MLWWTLWQLKSENAETRRRAAEKVGNSRDARAVEPLVAALKDKDSDVRRVAAAALKSLGWQPVDDVQRALQAAVRRAWERCYPNQPVPSEPPESEMQSHCGVGSFFNTMPNGDVFPCHVLTEREFRCGNVCEQSLLEICRRNGLLGELQALDFQELARQDERVLPLTRPNTCMGTVYAKTRELPVWRNNLTMLQFGDEANK